MKIFLFVLLFFAFKAHAEGLHSSPLLPQQHKEFHSKLDLSIGFVDKATRLPFDHRLYAEPKPWLDFGKKQKVIPVPELRFRIDNDTTLKLRGRGFKFEMRFDAK